jgi:hypothetical protein
MGEDRNRSVGPGQWAPWISDPDPPEPPMTEEQMTAAAKATKDLVPQVPASPSSKTPPKTAEDYERMREQVINDLLRAHPTLTREEAEKHLEGFL